MGTILEFIWELFTSAFLVASGIVERATEPLRRLARVFVGILLGMIVMMVTAIKFDNQLGAIVTTMLASVFILVPYHLGGFSVKIVEGLAKILKFEDKAKAAESVRALFRPLTTLSLIFAFISVWVSIKGTGMFHTGSFWVALTMSIFFFIYMVYTESTKKYAGYVMVAIVCAISLQYVFPDQYNVSKRWAISAQKYIASKIHRDARNKQADAVATFAPVTESGPLYDMDGKVAIHADGRVRRLVPGQRVMVHSVREDFGANDTGEPMEGISLADEYGIFSATTAQYTFPKRKLGEYKTVSTLAKAGGTGAASLDGPVVEEYGVGEHEISVEGTLSHWILVPEGYKWEISASNALVSDESLGEFFSVEEKGRIKSGKRFLVMMPEGGNFILYVQKA